MTILESLWWKYRHRIFPKKYFIGADRDVKVRLTTIVYTHVDRHGVYHVDRIERKWHDGAVMSITGHDADKLVDWLNKRKGNNVDSV